MLLHYTDPSIFLGCVLCEKEKRQLALLVKHQYAWLEYKLFQNIVWLKTYKGIFTLYFVYLGVLQLLFGTFLKEQIVFKTT